MFHFKQNCSSFSCEKLLLNVPHDKKGSSKFLEMVLLAFAITSESSFHFENIFEVRQVNW